MYAILNKTTGLLLSATVDVEERWYDYEHSFKHAVIELRDSKCDSDHIFVTKDRSMLEKLVKTGKSSDCEYSDVYICDLRQLENLEIVDVTWSKPNVPSSRNLI
jgi:hypothetical protein